MNAIDFEFDLQVALGFKGNSLSSGYKTIGSTLLRIKDHEANYSYFTERAEDGDITKIVSVNYTNEDCKNDCRMTKDEFCAQYPNIKIVEINFDFNYLDLDEAIELIKSNI